jgi:hypothetical protein
MLPQRLRDRANLKHDFGTKYWKRKLDALKAILDPSIREDVPFCVCCNLIANRLLRIAVHPAGNCYASGGEDGFVRVHHFDDSYFKAKPYGDLDVEE